MKNFTHIKHLFCNLAVFFLLGLLPGNSIAQVSIWGLSDRGGLSDAGVIFSTDSLGTNLNVHYDFLAYEGAKPLFTSLLQASDGFMYGLTYEGGEDDLGVLFKWNPQNAQYTRIMSFHGNPDGSKPLGSLIQASDGLLYGLTYKGGQHNKGSLFSFDPVSGIFAKKIDFDSLTTGCYPHGALMQAQDGKLYGMTIQGGLYNNGVIFQYDPQNNLLTKEIDFDGLQYGANPLGSLIQASDGRIYGMTCNGGANNQGVLFQYNPLSAVMVNKLNFDSLQGFNPLGSLLQASDSNLYALTSNGGMYNMGTLFKFDLSNDTYTKLLDFDGTSHGSYPFGTLIQASDTCLYGFAKLGGTYDAGVLFQYNLTSHVYTKRFDFDGGTNGSSPCAGLTQATNGHLYGMTNFGGANHIGVLFQYDPVNAALSKQFDFGSIDGSNPVMALVQSPAGLLYGVTAQGGNNNAGVLYQIDPQTNTYLKKVDFDSGTLGSNPSGALAAAGNQRYLGLTRTGGDNAMGTLYQYHADSNTVRVLASFEGTSNGSYPTGSLLIHGDDVYGTTSSGGSQGAGTLFHYSIASAVLTTIADFDSILSGSEPNGSLILAPDGNIYGMTQRGGAYHTGVIFQYSVQNHTLSKKIDLDSLTTGAYPYSSFTKSGVFLYGTTTCGGANHGGTLVRYDPVMNHCVSVVNFDGVLKGSAPCGDLLLRNGLLYGLTRDGGISGQGVMYQYDPVSDVYTKKNDFNAMQGSRPTGNLVLVCNNPGAATCMSEALSVPEQLSGAPEIHVFPNPNHGTFTIQGRKNGEFRLTGILGQIMEIRLSASNNWEYRLEGLASGMYILTGTGEYAGFGERILVID